MVSRSYEQLVNRAGTYLPMPRKTSKLKVSELGTLALPERPHACERLALGMTVCLSFSKERPSRPWAEQVLPYGLAHLWLITPSSWTLTEVSREVHLPALP